jgi:hypothetical protein
MRCYKGPRTWNDKVKEDGLGWAGYAARLGKKSNAYSILVGKAE